MKIFRENIDAMTGYVPGEQPAPGEKVIKLNTNENPYPPSPKAMDVLRSFDPERLRLYPQPTARRFCQAVAGVLGVPGDWVLAGNGSDDLLTMIFRACAEPGRTVAYPMPTYVLYRTLAQIQDARTVEVPFDEEFHLPVAELAAAKAAVTLVASPNSPSGTSYAAGQLSELAKAAAGLLVIDEAYADFAEHNALGLVERHENVIILRTLSKGYSMAGLRLGFGVARPAVLDGLMKVKDSYNVDAVACLAGAAAVEDRAYHDECVAKVKASRAALAAGLEALGCRVWPSESNFLLTRPPAGRAGEIYEDLKRRRILVRYFNQPGLRDRLRISVGTGEQNEALLAALRQIIGGT